jgi:hypothetical protein
MPSSFRVKNHPDFLGVKCIGIFQILILLINNRFLRPMDFHMLIRFAGTRLARAG